MDQYTNHVPTLLPVNARESSQYLPCCKQGHCKYGQKREKNGSRVIRHCQHEQELGQILEYKLDEEPE